MKAHVVISSEGGVMLFQYWASLLYWLIPLFVSFLLVHISCMFFLNSLALSITLDAFPTYMYFCHSACDYDYD